MSVMPDVYEPHEKVLIYSKEFESDILKYKKKSPAS